MWMTEVTGHLVHLLSHSTEKTLMMALGYNVSFILSVTERMKLISSSQKKKSNPVLDDVIV
jgi:hypothetical protein